MKKNPSKSECNKKLAADLSKKGLSVYEIYNPDPKKKDEVIALLVGATCLPKNWLRWIEEKLQ